MKYTYYIYQDKKLIKQFDNQDTDVNVFGWMLRNQGQSIHWALKYGGWHIEYGNGDGSIYNYADNKVLTNPLTQKQ